MKLIYFIGISISIFFGENLTSVCGQEDNENTPIPPALTCVVIGDAACDRMCKMIGHIYATPVNPAKCDSSNNCECSIREHKFLDDLWKDKFTSAELLETIKTDEQLYEDILAVMKTPFRTREQTKSELEWYIPHEQFAQLRVNDNVAENMIKNNGKGELDRDNIRTYVNKSLLTDPFQLPADFCSKTRFRNALENAPNEDTIQYIIHDVRRSKNPVLNELADAFLKEKNIQEEKDEDDDTDDVDDTLTDILDLVIVSEFISPSEITNEDSATSSTTNTEDATSGQWDLPNLDVSSVEKFNDGYQCWTNDNPNYKVCQFKAVWGERHVWWTKANDSVNISIDDTGAVSQDWSFEDGVRILIDRKSNGEMKQTWKFSPDMQLEYIVNSEKVAEEKWLNDKKDDKILAKYKSVIDSWCDKNRIFIEEKFCVIY